MNPDSGAQLLQYRLAEKIGEGGMGEVWRAVDTTLDREVAIKFLPEAFVGDGERLARFVREAKLLATLNHPNIAAVYGLHEAEGRHFIAMELVPGQDLAERLQQGALPVEDAIDVARQVADALEAAHEQGVIHRDLKPANIKRTPDGQIKVLDLGLAKALTPETSGDPVSASLSPTVTSAGTVAGTLLGTAAYMAPEQAKGRAVDRRADIWAFGVVLYEMLTGRQLFRAETISETLAALLRDELSMEDLPAETPAGVRRLLERCLERSPKLRLRDIGEARIALTPESLAAAPAVDDSIASSVPAAGRAWLPWVLVALLAAFGLWAMNRGGKTPAVEPLKLAAWLPPELRIPVDQMGAMALSPDGKALALTLVADGEQQLYVRRLDTGTLIAIDDTRDARSPFFSPDGRWVGFFADDLLKKVPVGGGAPITICGSQGANRGGSWGTDDRIVFAPHYVQPLMRVPATGGDPEPLTEIDTEKGERTHRWPQSVPGRDLILFTVGTIDSPESYDDARIVALRPDSGERKVVLERASMARYLPTGHLLYGREGFLFAVPFDIDTLETTGKPVPVVDEVMGMGASGIVHFEVSNDGLLAYLPGASLHRENRLIVHDRDGTVTPLAAPLQGYLQPRMSPDGKRIAIQYPPASTFDLGIYDIERETFTRMTFKGDNILPTWSPDGRWLAFGSVRDDQLQSVWIKAADGSGTPREICTSADFGAAVGGVAPEAWTPDGKTLIVQYANPMGNNIGLCSVETGEVEVWLETPAGEQYANLSPDGRWLAYGSDEAGTFQVFVQAFPGPGGKWQISTEGGILPRWSPDGSRLFYRFRDRLHEVLVDGTAGSFSASRPRLVLQNVRSATSDYFYDPVDNDRFLFVEDQAGQDANRGVTVVVNWFEELKRLVP